MIRARRTLAALIAGLAFMALPALAETSVGDAEVVRAEYGDPTTRYAHGVLGDAVEWGSLILRVNTCIGCAGLRLEARRITLPDSRVFEDTAPRVVDLGDGLRAAMVVESDVDRGARLALYGARGLITATPFIGQTHRWLAPIGAGDLDGDGAVELAYIDRPHLTKRLRVWRFADGALHPVADLDGLTNHRIGWDFITGGLRDCGQGPEIIVVNADWTQVMAARLHNGTLRARVIAPYRNSDSVKRALICP
ncbi:VCBS repeat-containing protein [Rhodobacteraceae bacterium KMM 6894]|nr:VCBS repeat-containing protein [Rhodobacteraceae bacterium KMM 6894]